MPKDCNVGIKAVVRVGDSFLLLKSAKGYADFPGGRIESDETIFETLERELKEELPSIGQYKIGRLLHTYRRSKNLIDDRALILVFYEVIAEPFTVTLSDEHVGYEWFTDVASLQTQSSSLSIDNELLEVIRIALSGKSTSS